MRLSRRRQWPARSPPQPSDGHLGHTDLRDSRCGNRDHLGFVFYKANLVCLIKQFHPSSRFRIGYRPSVVCDFVRVVTSEDCYRDCKSTGLSRAVSSCASLSGSPTDNHENSNFNWIVLGPEYAVLVRGRNVVPKRPADDCAVGIPDCQVIVCKRASVFRNKVSNRKQTPHPPRATAKLFPGLDRKATNLFSL